MYLTKKHLSRRTVLRAAGVALGLPLLDAMIPAATALAQTAAAPKLRAGFFYLPHGAIMWNTPYGAEMDHWTPSGAGAEFKLSRILAPLETHKRYVTSFGNIENRAPQGSVHTLVPATWLSGVRPNEKATGAMMAPTIDQMIAEHIGQDTVLPSLEVASETTIQSAACGTGACYYSSTLSFRNPTTPLPMEFNPRKVFVQLFGAGDTPEERETISHRKASVLDMVNGRTNELQRTLGPRDRVVLEDYLESVRETERRIAKASQRDLTGIELPDAPIGELPDFDQQVRLMFDLIVLAYQADVTRVASYIMVGEGTNRTYNHIGVSDAFHPAFPSRQQHGTHPEAGEGTALSRGAVRRVRRQARQDSRRRWVVARPLDAHVRVEHEQQRPPQQLSVTDHPRRRRSWRASRGSARGLARVHDLGEFAPHGGQQGRARAQELVGQHG